MYCKALFFRGGLIFAYFAENENSAKIKPAKIKIGKSHCKSVGVVCMHAYCTTHTKLLSLSAEIHKVPVLHPFIVLCTLWIALPTSTHKLQSILANKRKRKNRPQCESAKINPARILILAKARKKDPREKRGFTVPGFFRGHLISTFERFFFIFTDFRFSLN